MKKTMFWITLTLVGALALFFMPVLTMPAMLTQSMPGYGALVDGDHFIVTGEGEMDLKITSDQGSETCIYPEGAENPMVCSSQFIGNTYTAEGKIGPGEYIVRGANTLVYVSGQTTGFESAIQEARTERAAFTLGLVAAFSWCICVRVLYLSAVSPVEDDVPAN